MLPNKCYETILSVKPFLKAVPTDECKIFSVIVKPPDDYTHLVLLVPSQALPGMGILQTFGDIFQFVYQGLLFFSA